MWLSIPRSCYHWEVSTQRVSILARGAGCRYSPGHSRTVCYYVIYIFGMRCGGYVLSHCRLEAMIASQDVVWVSLSRGGCRLAPPGGPQYCYVSRALGR